MNGQLLSVWSHIWGVGRSCSLIQSIFFRESQQLVNRNRTTSWKVIALLKGGPSSVQRSHHRQYDGDFIMHTLNRPQGGLSGWVCTHSSFTVGIVCKCFFFGYMIDSMGSKRSLFVRGWQGSTEAEQISVVVWAVWLSQDTKVASYWGI